MNLADFLSNYAILSDYDLDSYEGKKIWLVVTSSPNGEDWYAQKIAWEHNGLFNHRGDKFGDTQHNRILFCQNGENTSEYFLTQSFIHCYNPNSLNSIFPSEELADTFITTTILTRNSTDMATNKLLSSIISDRMFAHSGTDAHTLFDMISLVDESLLNTIPIFSKGLTHDKQ